MTDASASFERLASSAVSCRHCFDVLGMSAALIDVAQPRYIGPDYWNTLLRVAIVCLNPGAGKSRLDKGNERFRDHIRRFRDGNGPLSVVLEHQEQDMPFWGKPQGRFEQFYFSSLGLSQKNVALANIAWCATAGDKYPPAMLSACFERFTNPLIQLLLPHVVLLSGSGTHRFATPLRRSPKSPRVITMLHYAHREGSKAEHQELVRVRKLLAELSKNVI